MKDIDIDNNNNNNIHNNNKSMILYHFLGLQMLKETISLRYIYGITVLPACWHATLNMTYKGTKHSIRRMRE